MSLPQAGAPCPDEDNPSEGAPGKVEDDELVIRVAAQRDWVIHEPDRTTLSTAAFPKSQLQGKAGASVSLMRPMTPAQDVLMRARAVTKAPEWAEDPVLGRALTVAIRGIVDANGRREFCVNADVVDDQLGRLVTHASLLRSCPVPDSSQRAEWQAVRLEVAQSFDVRHCSGAAVEP